ncbi:MSCRAMM family protein [Photobacterium alginatilyticum]|uniref:MSCRAMM family protein n=1 Tax=Photobacterium alginatilyticum TaxID=1775171 RepID=UPI0040688E36
MKYLIPTCRSVANVAGLVMLSASLIAVSSTSAYAHRMKAFSWVEGQAIEGEAYFTNGQMAADSTVELLVDQKVVATTQSDEEGQFRFEALAAGDYQIRADAGQGHVATYNISASEFSVDESDMGTVVDPSGPEASQLQKPVDSTLSKAQVEQAVAKAIRPLREQLDQYEAKVRLHDILGGIGYIFGLFGLFVLYRSRRQ